MELNDYLRILRRRWRLVVVIFLLAVAVAGVFTWRATPQYESEAQLFVSTTASESSEAFAGGSYSTQRVASYADLTTGTELAARVVSATGLDLDPRELAQRVTAQAAPDTVLLSISVRDDDPELAQTLTDSYSRELISLIAELETPPGADRPVLKATVVDAAHLPETPVSPQPLRNLALAAVLGLLLGVGVAVVRELLDTSVKTPEDVTEILDTGLLGTIGFDSDVTKHPLVTDLGPHDPRTEAFRVLRTNLQFVDIDADSSKAIVVTSAVPGEGKSTTAANTALALGQTRDRVLLVDADLRRPQIAQLLGLDDSVGLTTTLVGQVPLADAIQHHDAGIDVLTSGRIPPNPAELLQSRAMEGLLAELRSRYAVIVFDAPPLLPVTDAALIASQVDGAVVVVRHGRTTREQLAVARERLASVGADALGAVINMVPAKHSGTYGYGYGYGYAPDSGRRKARATSEMRID